MSEKWRSVTASAPAKVILHGEHSVVYGKLALAASIDLRTRVTINLSKKQRCGNLRVNLLNYSKNSLEFDLGLLSAFECKDSSKEKLDEDLKEDLSQIVSDKNVEKHLESGLVALLYLCVAFFKESKQDLVPLEITVDSDIPMGAGLGSSAAFSVALAAALNSLIPLKKADKDAICHWAFMSEKIIHGNPSGN